MPDLATCAIAFRMSQLKASDFSQGLFTDVPMIAQPRKVARTFANRFKHAASKRYT